ncbi:L,D-transpeptidase [Haloferula chungangensis]|uniref:L,D-transpeptidase n=1 Tax=Haloferula chungangensis TaxID=1048331 RepID=A0ABW2L954_9BACT
MRKAQLLIVATLALSLPACIDLRGPQPSGIEAYDAYERPATRPTDPSAVRVKVSTSRQRVYVMEGDKPLLVMPVSVGMPDSPTPLGEFRVTRKDARERSRNLGYAFSGDQSKRCTRSNKPAGWSFKGAPLPYWVEFKPGIGFHTGWIKHTPCTDGSIRMHKNVAPKFFELVSRGTPISIALTQAEDYKYGSIPLPPDSGPLPDHSTSYYLSDASFSDHKPLSFE